MTDLPWFRCRVHSSVFKRPRWPFLKTITTLVIVDTVLWVVTGMYWLLNWQAVFR